MRGISLESLDPAEKHRYFKVFDQRYADKGGVTRSDAMRMFQQVLMRCRGERGEVALEKESWKESFGKFQRVWKWIHTYFSQETVEHAGCGRSASISYRDALLSRKQFCIYMFVLHSMTRSQTVKMADDDADGAASLAHAAPQGRANRPFDNELQIPRSAATVCAASKMQISSNRFRDIVRRGTLPSTERSSRRTEPTVESHRDDDARDSSTKIKNIPEIGEFDAYDCSGSGFMEASGHGGDIPTCCGSSSSSHSYSSSSRRMEDAGLCPSRSTRQLNDENSDTDAEPCALTQTSVVDGVHADVDHDAASPRCSAAISGASYLESLSVDLFKAQPHDASPFNVPNQANTQHVVSTSRLEQAAWLSEVGPPHVWLEISLLSAVLMQRKKVEKPFITLTMFDAIGRMIELPQDSHPGILHDDVIDFKQQCICCRTRVSEIPAGSFIVLEVKQWKSAKHRFSTIAWSHLSTESIMDTSPLCSRIRSRSLVLPLLRKPINTSARGCKRFNSKGAALHVAVTGVPSTSSMA